MGGYAEGLKRVILPACCMPFWRVCRFFLVSGSGHGRPWPSPYRKRARHDMTTLQGFTDEMASWTRRWWRIIYSQVYWVSKSSFSFVYVRNGLSVAHETTVPISPPGFVRL